MTVSLLNSPKDMTSAQADPTSDSAEIEQIIDLKKQNLWEINQKVIPALQGGNLESVTKGPANKTIIADS